MRRAHRVFAGWLAAALVLVPAMAVIDGLADTHHFCVEHDSVEHGASPVGSSSRASQREHGPTLVASDTNDEHESCPFDNLFQRDNGPVTQQADVVAAPMPPAPAAYTPFLIDVPPIAILRTAPKLPPPHAA